MAKHAHPQSCATKHRNMKYNKNSKAKRTWHNKRDNKISNTRKRRSIAAQQLKNNTNHKFIMNLSSHKLTTAEINALGKGLKFTPTPKRPSRVHLLRDANRLIGSTRLQYTMRHKTNQKHSSNTSPYKDPTYN